MSHGGLIALLAKHKVINSATVLYSTKTKSRKRPLSSSSEVTSLRGEL